MLIRRSRPSSPAPKEKGLTSLGKSVATGQGMSTEKKHRASPLPVQIDMIENNLTHLANNMSLADLLRVELPKRQVIKLSSIINQPEEQTDAKHIDMSNIDRRRYVSSSLKWSTLTDDVFLGKRRPKVSISDIDEGIKLNLINWHDLKFNKKVVDRLIQSMFKDCIKQES